MLWLLWRRVGEMVLVLTPLLLGAALTVASMVVLPALIASGRAAKLQRS